ncbi:G2/mitotic-specific cyclin S13-7-like isoform X2 [Phoenix dactylifera]|uniref:G2/mitotic-specific cyclin S13-7-like isoform X2 n=1 Tax=Phoenix dactylifera TaxID=42345 RepID=A0A8B9ARR9_PHODC|nr:G2/mitotic-specific cyclin S13-7-like isoform X2 [Phoenix dactylifera]
MATRHQAVVSQQQKGGVAPAGKQKAAAGAAGKNRRALGDIGNVVNVQVVEGKPLPPINRPITSFGAQLLANAQAAAAAANKKPVAIPAHGAAVATGAAKAAKKVTVKPKPEKPEKVIEISPDTEEKTKEKPESSSSRSRPSKKKVHTLTKVLTARSKAACGVAANKTKELVLDIDASDANDQLAVVDYVEDIYKFYKLAENSSRPHDYMDSQVEINAKMRAILVDWLIEVHHKFELQPETLYLTMYVIDRYLSEEIVLRRELQLVGVSAMLIACKYEEIWAPEVNDFICISDRAYTREQILVMEKGILNKLGWSLTVPTPYVFLVRFLKAALSDKEMEHMVFFFSELALMQYSMIMFCPSMVAASAVYAARCTLNKSPLWTETLRRHTGFSEPQLLDCTQMLVNSHSAAPESKLKIVYKKYSGAQFGAVALQPPATKLLEELNALRK